MGIENNHPVAKAHDADPNQRARIGKRVSSPATVQYVTAATTARANGYCLRRVRPAVAPNERKSMTLEDRVAELERQDEEHVCEEIDYCTCSIIRLEPDEYCPIHGGCRHPPRCAECGQFMILEAEK